MSVIQNEAKELDDCDDLKDFKNEFILPQLVDYIGEISTIYLCGNSLGLQPKGTLNLFLNFSSK
jgi:kynureninase